MRFPALKELDRDQKAVYGGAPPNETIMVIGPPGSGKTVMAFHRAALLAAMDTSPSVIMHSKVLATYTKQGSESDGSGRIKVSTLHHWAYHWWQRVSGRRGNPPALPNDRYRHDWNDILVTVIKRLSDGDLRPSNADWSHLIIDEGQDFPPAMYSALSLIAAQIRAAGKQLLPAVTVFADDNQRLTADANSSLEEIRRSLGFLPTDKNIFKLRRNYRNTLPIAKFAACFQVNLASGVAELPSRQGPIPRISRASGLEAVRSYLARYVNNNPGKAVGVLCSSEAHRRQLFNSLTARLKSNDATVQTYSHADRERHPATDLEFDQSDVVTVLNFQSAKGLEFDAVFVVDPFAAYRTGGAGDQAFKMQMYVMCTRAREYLDVIIMSPEAPELLPPAELYESQNIG